MSLQPHGIRHRANFCLELMTLTIAVVVANGSACAWDQKRGGRLELTVVDRDSGERTPCRMHLTRVSANKPFRAPRLPNWHDHFVFPGHVVLKLPRGKYTFEVERGPEYVINTGHFTIEDFADDSKRIELVRAANMVAEGWWAGDLHVERPRDHIELLMQAEELYFTALVDSTRESKERNPPHAETAAVRFDTERIFLPHGLQDIQSGTALLALGSAPAWRHTLSPATRPWTLDELKTARQQGAWIDVTRPTARWLPLWLAADVVDSIELAHANFGRHRTMEEPRTDYTRDRHRYPGASGVGRWSQEIYYHVLNAGLRIPPSAGSGSGSEPNPVGYSRLYVHVGAEFDEATWWTAFVKVVWS